MAWLLCGGGVTALRRRWRYGALLVRVARNRHTGFGYCGDSYGFG